MIWDTISQPGLFFGKSVFFSSQAEAETDIRIF